MPERTKAESFEELQLKRLKKLAAQLVNLLKDGVPKAIIAHQISMIAQAGIGYCGPQILTILGKSMLRDIRKNNGFCPSCKGDPNPCPPSEIMCAPCDKELEEIEEELGGEA